MIKTTGWSDPTYYFKNDQLIYLILSPLRGLTTENMYSAIKNNGEATASFDQSFFGDKVDNW